MKTFGNFTDDVKIDKMKLADECELQPVKYGYYAQQYAEAKNVLETAKQNLDATFASRSLFYRRNPPLDIKPTEAVYDALLGADREVQDAKEVVSKAQGVVNLLYASVSSIEQCKGMIDNLVKLQGMNYYGTTGGTYDDAAKRLN